MNRSPTARRLAGLLPLVVLALLIVVFLDRHDRRDRVPRRSAESGTTATVRRFAVVAAAAPIGRAIVDVLPGASGVADWRTFTPKTITVAVAPGLEFPFHKVSVSEENGVTTWVGRNGLKGASLVGIGKRDSWFGVLSMSGASYDVYVHGNTAVLTEHSAPVQCGTKESVPEIPRGTEASLLANVVPHADTAPAQVIAGNAAVHVSGSTIYTVDVAFFYTQDVAQALTDPLQGYYTIDGQIHPYVNAIDQVQDYLDSTYRGYIATCNLMAEQSLVGDLRWHFVGIFLAPNYTREVLDTFVDGGVTRNHYRMAIDLGAMESTFGQDGKFYTFLHDTEESYAVDQAVLIVTWGDFGGLADMPGNNAVVGVHAPVTSLGHELGHNFGLHHDRYTEGTVASDGDGNYFYGYSFPYNPKAFGGPDYSYRVCDIMGYGADVPYFSNPNISFTGNELGLGSVTDTTRYAFGVDVGQPTAAYAARYLSEHVTDVANHRTPAGVSFPTINVQPLANAAAIAGGEVQLSVGATGSNTYQWRKDGVAIDGATNSTLSLTSVTAATGGTYDVMVTNALGSVISRAASVSVTSDPVTSRLLNISTRSMVGTGNSVQIAGFVISGVRPKTVLIRASGPALAALGLSGALADPMLELHDASKVIATNDDWGTDAAMAASIRTAADTVKAFPWADGSKDAALLVTLNPGLYSAVVSGKAGSTGIALIEVYEVTPDGGKVVNISTRSPVASGSAVQIAGFVIGGSGPRTVLIRASGPALTAAGLSGGLADPTLELHDSGGTIVGYNDDWGSDAASADAIRTAADRVQAFRWADGSKDAALLVTLSPGLYSAVVAGANNTTGVALIEVYDLGSP